jgi:3-deoxy-D-manno-octulosonic-acid transferase
MYILYDILVHLLFLSLLPYFLLRMAFEGRYRSGLKERFGFIPGEKLNSLSGFRVVWFHAVSVGETKAVIPLLRLFKRRHPEVKMVFSTVTPTGNSIAEKEGEPFIDALIYMPLDMGWVVRKVVRAVRPEAFIVVEKELWPNIVRILSAQGIPVVVVNGTISDGSFKSYRGLSFFFRPLFSRISFFCARTEEDARKARLLGFDPSRVVEAGNLKFDWAPVSTDASSIESFAREVRFAPDDLVIVSGSTHAGEEEILLKVYNALKEEFRNLKLVIAPRHPERFDEVEALLTKSGLSYARRTGGAAASSADIVLLDTIGELSLVYGLSTVAFVGGTLVDIGGHNLLEPAFFGKPVVYGPYLGGYLYMAEMLEGAGAGVRVTPEDLTEKLGMLLRDEELRNEKGNAAGRVVDANRGATEMCARVIEGVLKCPGG